jgi:hypothetical protein
MMKRSFRKIAKTLTGFATPFFGVSWNPPASDREQVRSLITFLEDRRVLYNPYPMERDEWVIKSVLAIRARLTELLEGIDEASPLVGHFQVMRAACRKFLNEVDVTVPHWFGHYLPHPTVSAPLAVRLGEMRAVFGLQIAQLCAKYGVDVSDDLASILPPEDK